MASKIGRPTKAPGERYVAHTFTLTPAQVKWLDEMSTKHMEQPSASAVVRAALRHAHASLRAGTLTETQFKDLMT